MSLIIPTEEQLLAIYNEVAQQAEEGRDGNDKSISEHLEICEFCKINKELDKRNDEAHTGNVNMIDQVTFMVAQSCPPLGLMCSTPAVGQDILTSLSVIARMCFLMGYKAKTMQIEAEQLNRMFGNI